MSSSVGEPKPMKIEPSADYRALAAAMYQFYAAAMYVAAMDVGFSERQAFSLTTEFLCQAFMNSDESDE